MKTRNGFVSNSSSASFILVWGPKVTNPNNTIVNTICGALNCIDWAYNPKDDSVDKELRDVIDYIVEHTEIKQIGVDTQYETTAFTTMMNSFADFPYEISKFALALLANPEYRIYHAKIEEHD